jgi:predicted DNA-binding antitoxin AbrB/MazE fold protein
MQQIVKAVYEHGVFRPLQAPELSEGQEVQLIVQSKNLVSPSQMLNLAAEVYQDFSDQQIHDIEHIALERQNFFGEAAEQ